MTKPMFKLLGALAAVGVLAVAPSVARAAPSSAGEAGGGGGCDDHNAPWSRWGHTWWGSNGDGPYGADGATATASSTATHGAPAVTRPTTARWPAS